MLLSGLNSIDFSGLMGLGDSTLPPQQAADIIWDNATGASFLGYNKASFQALILPALSSGEYSILQSSVRPSGSLSSADVISTINSKRSADDGPLSGPQQSFINLVFGKLNANNYYAVGRQQNQAASQPSSLPSESPGGGSSGFWNSILSVPSNVTQAITSVASSVTGQSAQPIFTNHASRPALPNIYKTIPYTQTPADRKRLVWIIGGFGLLFAVAFGVIAARRND